jgi:hypothetical protein
MKKVEQRIAERIAGSGGRMKAVFITDDDWRDKKRLEIPIGA